MTLDSVAIVNIASTETTALGYVSARPCGTTQISSLINTTPSENTANMTAVGPGTANAMCVQSNVPSHLIVDQVGAFVR